MNASSEGSNANSQREDCGTGPELGGHNDQRNLGAAGIGILQLVAHHRLLNRPEVVLPRRTSLSTATRLWNALTESPSKT